MVPRTNLSKFINTHFLFFLWFLTTILAFFHVLSLSERGITYVFVTLIHSFALYLFHPVVLQGRCQWILTFYLFLDIFPKDQARPHGIRFWCNILFGYGMLYTIFETEMFETSYIFLGVFEEQTFLSRRLLIKNPSIEFIMFADPCLNLSIQRRHLIRLLFQNLLISYTIDLNRCVDRWGTDKLILVIFLSRRPMKGVKQYFLQWYFLFLGDPDDECLWLFLMRQ